MLALGLFAYDQKQQTPARQQQQHNTMLLLFGVRARVHVREITMDINIIQTYVCSMLSVGLFCVSFAVALVAGPAPNANRMSHVCAEQIEEMFQLYGQLQPLACLKVPRGKRSCFECSVRARTCNPPELPNDLTLAWSRRTSAANRCMSVEPARFNSTAPSYRIASASVRMCCASR